MRDGMTCQQSHYFGRAVAYVITMIHPFVNMTKGWREIYNKMVDEEQKFRECDRFHYLFEDFYTNSRDEKWTEYFNGVKKGIEEVLTDRGIKEDGSHLLKTKKSKKILNLISVVRSFLEDSQKEEFVISRNEDFNVEKSKVYVTSINLVYKMQKIRNIEYMQGLAEDLGNKIATNNEVISAVGKVLSGAGKYISNFGVRLGGVTEIPEEVIGIIPAQKLQEEEDKFNFKDSEVIKTKDLDKKVGLDGNLDTIKSNVLKYDRKEVKEKANSKEIEEEIKFMENQKHPRVSIKDFNLGDD